MRILFTDGGTGGHIYPIIAIKNAFDENFQKENKFLYMGLNDFTGEIIKKEGIKCKFIFTGKFRRYFSLLNLVGLFKIPFGIVQSLWHLFWFVPDVVFGKGSSGSIPVVFAAWIYRIPIIIHDSDAVPGMANKFFTKFAKETIISFEGTKKYFKAKQQKKLILIGNPIRKELLTGDKIKAKEIFKISTSKPVLLMLGGSQGAQRINEIITNTLPRLLEISEVIHVCGKENYKIVEAETQKSPDYHLFPFLNVEQLKHAYALADLIINRAGAGSIFEIAAIGKPSILIPLPDAAQDHQRENAFEFSDKGSRAIVLDQENLTPNLLLEQVSNLLSNPELMKKMGDSAKSFYDPQTPELIRDEILKFTK